MVSRGSPSRLFPHSSGRGGSTPPDPGESGGLVPPPLRPEVWGPFAPPPAEARLPGPDGSRTSRGFWLIAGPPEVYRRVLEGAVGWALCGGWVFWLDAHATFDPFPVGEWARGLGVEPEGVLRRIWVARAFTLYQLEALLRRRLPQALRGHPRSLGIVAGPWDLYQEADPKPLAERGRVWRRILQALDTLGRGDRPLVVVQPEAPRWMERMAGRVVRLH